jgi:hypothetical protein
LNGTGDIVRYVIPVNTCRFTAMTDYRSEREKEKVDAERMREREVKTAYIYCIRDLGVSKEGSCPGRKSSKAHTGIHFV